MVIFAEVTDNECIIMGRKGTPFPHLQFMAQIVPPPQIVIMLGKGTRPLSGPKAECSVPHL